MQLGGKIENIIRSKFPECFFTRKFMPSSNGSSLYIQFATTGKEGWPNGIIHNDPAYNTFWIRGMNQEGISISGYTLEASQIGLYGQNHQRIKIPWRDIKKPCDSKSITKSFDKYFSELKEKINSTVAGFASTEYTFEQFNSGFAYMDSLLKEIDEIVRRSEKGIGTSWEPNAVKRYRDAELQGLVKGTKSGNMASAKIAAKKATTFAELRNAVLKICPEGTTASSDRRDTKFEKYILDKLKEFKILANAGFYFAGWPGKRSYHVTLGSPETKQSYKFSHWYSCNGFQLSKQFDSRLDVSETCAFSKDEIVEVIKEAGHHGDRLPQDRKNVSFASVVINENREIMQNRKPFGERRVAKVVDLKTPREFTSTETGMQPSKC
jgi:hypothetical protein